MTLGTHADPDLAAARQAAAQAFRDRLADAFPASPPDARDQLADLLAEVAIDTVWSHAEHAGRVARRDGR